MFVGGFNVIARFVFADQFFYDYYHVLCAGFHRNSSVVELRAQCQNLKTLPSFGVVFIVFSLYFGACSAISCHYT